MKQFKELSKNEKWTQYLLLGVIGAAGLYFWDMILPFLIRMATNSLHLLGLLAVLGVIVVLLTDPKIRVLAKTMYLKAIQSITRGFIKHDPIGVMRVYIQQLKGRHREMDVESNNVAGEKGKLDKVIYDQHEEMLGEISRAKKAFELGEKGLGMVHQNQAGRLESSNKKMKNMADRMHKLMLFLKKLAKNTDLLIQDHENNLRTKEIEYKALIAGHKALQKGTSIFAGKDAEKDFYEDALKFLQEDMGQKMGQMDRYLEQSQEFITKMDIDSAVYTDAGSVLLDDLLNKDFTYLFESPEDNFKRIASGKITADELLTNSNPEPVLARTTKISQPKQISKSSNPYK